MSFNLLKAGSQCISSSILAQGNDEWFSKLGKCKTVENSQEYPAYNAVYVLPMGGIAHPGEGFPSL